jgi:hypothetical protein
MSQDSNEHTKSYALYRPLEQLENQFTLLTIYLVEIARVKLCKKNEILNAARPFSAIKPSNVPQNSHDFTWSDQKLSKILPSNFIC